MGLRLHSDVYNDSRYHGDLSIIIMIGAEERGSRIS